MLPPPLLVISAILSIQLGSALAAQLFPVLGAPGTVAWRLGFAALILLVFSRPRLQRTDRRAIAELVLFGVVIAAMNSLFYLAIARVPLGVVVAIEFLGPLGLAAWSATRWQERVWVALALVGVGLVTPIDGDGYDSLGVACAVLAGAGWAGFVVLARRVGMSHPGNSGIAIGMTIAALLMAPFAIAPAPVLFNDAAVLGTMVAVAILSTAVPFSLEFRALRRLSATAYGTLIALEPAVAAVAGALVLDQSPGTAGLLAIALVTVAAVGSSLTRRQPVSPAD